MNVKTAISSLASLSPNKLSAKGIKSALTSPRAKSIKQGAKSLMKSYAIGKKVAATGMPPHVAIAYVEQYSIVLGNFFNRLKGYLRRFTRSPLKSELRGRINTTELFAPKPTSQLLIKADTQVYNNLQSQLLALKPTSIS